jgi:methylated-DNA-[protein]-cysteine S-methyltransferase
MPDTTIETQVRWTEFTAVSGWQMQLVCGPDALLRVSFGGLQPERGWQRDDDCPLLADARRQIDSYLAGDRQRLDFPIQPQGTPFQQKVWGALRQIPYGQTRSYVDIAAASLGDPKATRAVGAANGRNPLPLIIPCHRVVNADGSLGGFSGGLEIKHFLLKLEGVLLL